MRGWGRAARFVLGEGMAIADWLAVAALVEMAVLVAAVIGSLA